MNLEHAQPDRAARPQSTGQADTRLPGGWLILARVAWGAVVVLVLLLFLVSLPTYLTHLQTVCLHQPCAYQQLTLSSARSLQASGISVEGYAALTLCATLVWVVMGGVLVWRRSDDWMALQVAFMRVVGGANNGLYGGFTTQASHRIPPHLLSVTAQESVVLAQESGRISRRARVRVDGEQFPDGNDQEGAVKCAFCFFFCL